MLSQRVYKSVITNTANTLALMTEEYRTFLTVIISSELYKFTELYEILLSMAFWDTFAFLKLGRFHRVNVSEYYRVIL
jgi:hypothetical protein